MLRAVFTSNPGAAGSGRVLYGMYGIGIGTRNEAFVPKGLQVLVFQTCISPNFGPFAWIWVVYGGSDPQKRFDLRALYHNTVIVPYIARTIRRTYSSREIRGRALCLLRETLVVAMQGMVDYSTCAVGVLRR